MERLAFKDLASEKALPEKDACIITDLGNQVLALKEENGKLRAIILRKDSLLKETSGEVLLLKGEIGDLKGETIAPYMAG